MQKELSDPKIRPAPSVRSSPAFIRARLAVGFFVFKKRLYFSLLICNPNNPLHLFFPYKEKKNRTLRFYHFLME